MTSARTRRSLIGIALIATLVAVWQLRLTEEAAPERRAPVRSSAAPPSAGKGQTAAPLTEVATQRLRRGEFPDSDGNAFPARSWRPPPPPAPVVAAPPPSAPPLPFNYMGKLIEGGNTMVFLTRGEANLVVKPGDTVDGIYRVEAVTPQGVEFLYLPMQQKQFLNLGRRQ